MKIADRTDPTEDGDRVESGGVILLKEQCSVTGSESREAGEVAKAINKILGGQREGVRWRSTMGTTGMMRRPTESVDGSREKN